ncbi:E3 ubiquitin-protein ligase trul-1-like [Musca autumnalis]|uniref:E3 ubiquitin-protein ligase trul-1-like n=1 Tax=Musca autumnalis TaxID=221902 RepID=UPI003CFB1B08
MPVLKSLCPICCGSFNNSKEIYSTSCGHIFHYGCLLNYQLLNADCPQCKAYRPLAHLVHLEFDENGDDPMILKENLQQTSDELAKLKEHLYERNLALAKSRTATDHELNDLKAVVTKLRTNIVCLEGAEKKNRQKICILNEEICQIESASENTIANLKRECDDLKDKLENSSTKLAIELSKNQKSKKGRQPQEKPMININLNNDKINNLEMKVLHLSEELEKEITQNTELQIENMKLKNYIECMNIYKDKK